MVQTFIFVELHPWVSKVPFPATQSWKKCVSEAGSNASVQSVQSMWEPVQCGTGPAAVHQSICGSPGLCHAGEYRRACTKQREPQGSRKHKRVTPLFRGLKISHPCSGHDHSGQ